MTLGAAIIGTGFIGQVHARSARLAGAEIVGVGASSAESGAAAAEQLGAKRVYHSPDEVADDPAVDVVHVCTPNRLHLPYARAALAAGKHVVCEKPLGIDLAEAHALRALAREAGVVATVPFAYRFYPTVREARARLAGGRLGDVRLIHGSYLQDWLCGSDVTNWRADPTQNGRSRAFADIGSHWCDLAEFVSGDRIERVCAVLSTWHERGGSDPSSAPAEQDTEDTAVVSFVTKSGATGSVVISQVSPGRKNRLWVEFDGTEGSATFDQENPDTLWLGAKQANVTRYRGEVGEAPEAVALSILPPGHPQGFSDSFGLFVEHTYAAIRGDVPDGLPTFEDGARAAAIVDAVLRSAESGGFVTV